ncbi:MAG: transcription-repair coupling factor [Chitinophagales bacterium]
MAYPSLIGALQQGEEFRRVLAELTAGASPAEQVVTGLSGSQRPLLAAALASGLGRPVLLVTHNAFEAERLYEDLHALLGEAGAGLFPALEVLPHEEIVQDPELRVRRLQVYEALAAVARSPRPLVVVAPVQAVLRRLLPPGEFLKHTFTLRADTRIELEELSRRLVVLGYERVGQVDGRGQFAVRGGLLDVFPVTHENPYRLEWWGDIVDTIRTFDVTSQRSLEPVEGLTLVPAREIVYTPEEAAAARPRLEAAREQGLAKLSATGHKGGLRRLRERIDSHLEALLERHYFPGVEQYLPYLFAELATLPAYLPGAPVLVDEPARVREAATQFLAEITETLLDRVTKGEALPKELDLFADWPEVQAGLTAAGHPLVHLSALGRRTTAHAAPSLAFPGRTPELFHGKVERLAVELKRWRREGYQILLAVNSLDRAKQLSSALLDHGVEVGLLPEEAPALSPGSVLAAALPLSTGGEFLSPRLVYLTELELYGRPRRRRLRPVEEGVRIASFTELKVGDYVVHASHGIGQYLGVETLVVEGIHRDYLVVKYTGEDRLYVPTDQVNLIQKYLGVEGTPPKLHKLGGAEWSRVKARVAESVRDLAENLLALYAAREAQPGHAFAPDTVWQREFEESFPYEETPDQLRAVEEVKADMEKGRPMDRLVCGDVGYGKTEVAVRAAFKAVMDGCQVAVLVPTTILAQQHYNTFSERFGNFPVKVAVLSRFQSAREQSRILAQVKTGEVDVVIGTHRLLSQDVHWHNLGLVVVDEEQRFGVMQKERLKELRKNVDVLTLTATPIPRTLHMALAGVREMSVIETPPEGRYPIRTYVAEYSDQLVREAVLRELARDGQVFYLYNHVRSIEREATRLEQLIPEARIAVAHGQMEERRLEEIMLGFLNGDYDLLVCSTIIESGLDIPNVNTLLVYDADRFGLSQLYQLRGRVGRSNRVAYAYFTFRREKILTEDAEKRLAAIREFTELGSGFKIAMRDLEIRGAGNLLGAEQHGFVAAVGFELYCQLLEDAVRELKGQKRGPELPEPTLDLPVDAYLPEEYIPDPRQKVEIYKKMLGVRSVLEARELTDELLDRFGEPPGPVTALLRVALLKQQARRAMLQSLAVVGGVVVARFLPGVSPSGEKLSQLIRNHRGRLSVTMGQPPTLKLQAGGKQGLELLDLLENLVGDLVD